MTGVAVAAVLLLLLAMDAFFYTRNVGALYFLSRHACVATDDAPKGVASAAAADDDR